jgi:predicted nucleic acid-binding protein
VSRVLADTSAWVEFLRGTGSRTNTAMRARVGVKDALATTDAVVMEVLAGARDATHRRQLTELLYSCDFIPVEGLADFEAAGDLFADCRRRGVTPRSLMDCLIATVARRVDIAVLAYDRDYERLAEVSQLRVAR